ncbi:Rft-1-domain-containing protein [Metschnikowia bicuspidata var. bicuspidata NRRL YB-4993]|uniref:Man(5)GlcNAc(2)-PP-dolichol translocation protein RFT1 n=1 Tax=Metschnikowia bicuspidata var. bicuspidata NRRL YB-4993 TaxID=869754 RepID=A0A1A0H677_9ASCO|nr:Rft-1-domain-containing protein [Metschnikowia bicuspidata var. bicuspidata NRRL YB-4993]OBA19418.1 Rft-1-domain-containing protein [Metschnikowia bicuspidata var. bicuspidata NRRL YB-4993]
MSSTPFSQVVYLVGSQVATKAVTFASNQVLLRRISPEIFGIATYLEFLVNTVIFFSREAVRIANQRANSEKTIVNFAYLPVILCGPILAVLMYLQTYSDLYQNTVVRLPYIGFTISLVIGLILLELCAEPFFALNQHKLNFKLRSQVESLATFLKCVSVFVAVAWWQKKQNTYMASPDLFKGQAVLSFAGGQFVYAAVLFSGYWLGSKSGIPKYTKAEATNMFDQNLLSVWRLLFLQMIFKHLLTEGDTMLISYLFTVAEQGVYSVIANYGSMIARLLFQPIEELVRVSFTRSIAQKDVDVTSLNQTMSQLMTFYFNLSLLIVIGGYTNGSFLLQVLLGKSEKWLQSSVFHEFPMYMLYIPFMAFNGILEAFFSSASTQQQIGQFSLFMSFLSVFVFTTMYVLIGKLKMGIRGLIFSNMINMSLRIAYCLLFYVKYFKKFVTITPGAVVKKLFLPMGLVFGALFVQRVLFHNGMSSTPMEFFQSLVICLFCLAGMIVNERQQLVFAFGRLTRKDKHE